MSYRHWAGRTRYIMTALAVVIGSITVIPAVVISAPAAAATTQGQAIVNAAASEAGIPYCMDGGDPSGPTHGNGGPGCGGSTSGFDCSGLALYAVYQATGIVLLHGSGMESAPGGSLISSQSDLQPGDLVFFGGGSLKNFEHVGIYAGNGMMWDANDYNVPVQQHSLAWEEAALSFDGGVRYWSSSGDGGGSSPTLWGVTSSGQAVRYAGNGAWTYQGGLTFEDIAASGSTVAAVSTTGGVYTYAGNGAWHLVSGATLKDVAVYGTNTLWGVTSSGQAVRYAGNGAWTYQGGLTFEDIAASGSTVAAVSTTGGVYTYAGNGAWHLVSGATLKDVAVYGTNTLWGVTSSGQAVRYAGNGAWTYQGGLTFEDIAASGSTVAAVSTTGGVYTYMGNGAWHLVSGATLKDVAVQ